MKQRQQWLLLCVFAVPLTPIYAAESTQTWRAFKQGVGKVFAPEPTIAANIRLSDLNSAPIDISSVQELPVVGRQLLAQPLTGSAKAPLGFIDAIHRALQHRPEITQSLAQVSVQSSRIDMAKAKYYPQINGGISTADLSKGERGRQLINLEATQMLYDFGKTKSGVSLEEARLAQEQAKVLLEVDNVAYQVANSIVNIKRYQEIVKIADQQIKGIARIAEIAQLRAKAGISSQADPVQAQSNLEAAQSNKIVQETQLGQYLQRLRTLLGADVSAVQWKIPDFLVQQSGLYEEPKLERIPNMLVAQLGVEVAQRQKQQSQRSAYPTLNLKGTLSQAVNGRHPNNNQDNGMYNSIMLEASSSLYQGGAIAAQTRSASYAEEAARAAVNSAYLDVLDQVRRLREEVENKQKQMQVLAARQETTIRTKELYQEQYKLGTRSAVDLLNAEQAIHLAAQEIESARYDIYLALVQYIQVTGRSRELYQLNNIAIQGFEIQP